MLCGVVSSLFLVSLGFGNFSLDNLLVGGFFLSIFIIGVSIYHLEEDEEQENYEKLLHEKGFTFKEKEKE